MLCFLLYSPTPGCFLHMIKSGWCLAMVVCMSVCLSVSVSVCERGVRGVRVKDGNEGKKRRTNTALSFLGQNTEMHSFMCRCRHQRCVCLCAQNNTALHQLFFFFFFLPSPQTKSTTAWILNCERLVRGGSHVGTHVCTLVLSQCC